MNPSSIPLTPESLPETPANEFVRSDISVAVLCSIVVGIVGAILIDWRVLLIVVAMTYMLVGLSTVWEWNARLREVGVVDRAPFTNITATGFVPAVLIVVAFHFSDVPFVIGGAVSVATVLLYEYFLYSIAIRGVADTDDLYFETDPFDGVERAYLEAMYIDRVERAALKAQNEAN